MADDDIERLLREVEAELGREPAKQSPMPSVPVSSGKAAPRPAPQGVVERMRAGVPRGVVVGALWGLVVGGVFSVVPVVDGLSGALAAFATGFGVSVAGRVRRR
jgi:hypothetical protein